MTITKAIERQLRALLPMEMPASLEGEAKALFEGVCCGSRPLWPLDTDAVTSPGHLRTEFYRLANDGMWAAQERFLARIAKPDQMLPGEESLYRTAMDTTAWHILQGQLCYARRVYREKRQPSLKNSNLDSVVGAARYFKEQNPNSMLLISDLTTFVQIGDILAADPESGFSIIEVKEGKRNHEIGDLATFYRESRCEHFKHIVTTTESEDTVKQFERMLRQMDRMDFASSVISKGTGMDPDSRQEVHIPDPVIPLDQWDDRLNALFDKAQDQRWAIDVIDGTLFVGCYADQSMRRASPAAFLPWLQKCSHGEIGPIGRLIDCVRHPLALPIFLVPTTPDRIMDLLFGRLHVCMGISIHGLVEECGKHHITVRPPTKRERKAMSANGASPVRYKGKPTVLERDGKTLILGEGVFLRAMFHFQRPLAVINALLDNSELLHPPSSGRAHPAGGSPQSKS